jgi:hypothetical protein
MYVILGVFENQVIARMHGVKQDTGNCIQRKIPNISSSPRSITRTETGESIYSFNSKI